MRITTLLAVFLTLFWTISACAEEVLYYGNGWPISLVERACDGDEGCLTELANCPPYGDGTCGAQVAWCNAYGDARAHAAELCVIDLRPGEEDYSWRITYSETLGSPVLERDGDAPCGYDTESGRLVCIRLIISPIELEAWAGLPIE